MARRITLTLTQQQANLVYVALDPDTAECLAPEYDRNGSRRATAKRVRELIAHPQEHPLRRAALAAVEAYRRYVGPEGNELTDDLDALRDAMSTLLEEAWLAR